MPTNSYNSKVIFNGEVLIDLTADTVAAAKLLEGATAHGKDGERVTGKMLDRNTVGKHGAVGASTAFPRVAVTPVERDTQAYQNTDGVSRLFLKPPAGHYDGTSYVGETFAKVASTIGLNAEKLMYSQQVLGITGTGVTRAIWHGSLPTDYSTYTMGTAPASGTLLFFFVGDADHDMQIQSITIGGQEVATPRRNNLYVAQFSVAAGQQITMRWSSNYGGGTPHGYGVICYV